MSTPAPRTRAAEPWGVHLALGVGLAIGLLLMAAGLAVLGYGYTHASRIMHGLSIQGVDVGGLAPYQALTRVQQTLDPQSLPYVRLQADGQAWVYSVATLGGSLDLEGAVEQAYRIGRAGPFREDLVTRARLLWRGYNIVPAFTLEPGLSLKPLRQIALQTGAPPRRARVWVAGLDVNNVDARVGRELDIAAAQSSIAEAVRTALGESGWNTIPRWRTLLEGAGPTRASFPGEPVPVTLQLRDLNPSFAELTAAYERASALLSGPVLLYYDEPLAPESDETVRRAWGLDRATLARWLVQPGSGAGELAAEVRLDREAMVAFVADLAAAIDRPARQGRYSYDPASATLTVVQAEQVGRTLDQAQALELLEAACWRTQDRAVALPVAIVEPPVTEAELRSLLPLDLISTGETSFAGSTPARLHNIEVAAAQFQGVAVPAGEQFSFVEHLGPVTIASGYAEGWVIMGNETVLGPGGGVCQVGTTFFRAAFWGGYPIVERTPHAYRVSWYEPPLGLDAAVYSPDVDIKFENDQPTPILIQTQVDRASGKLSFAFYGRSPGRKVTMEGPVIGETVPAGEPVLEPDPSLAPGQRVLVEAAHDGVTVTVYRVIEVNGNVVSREALTSRYAPWPARYRVGTQEGEASP